MKIKITYLLVFTLSITLSSAGQTPVLNSYPSASAVIMLDFDGHYVDGTPWNTFPGPISADSAGVSNNAIVEIFDRVAEDFRPFNITVTTNETVYNNAPLTQRIRIIITKTHQWYGTGSGGVAYIGSFTRGDDTPAFVFSQLLNFSSKNIAEAISHETGHTLGLRHQSAYDNACVKTSDYNWGQGSGEIGWAPIMGASYNRNLTIWHNGPNSWGCGFIQNDLDIITSVTNGFGFRTDDHTNIYATATGANFDAGGSFNINGVIETTADQDLFKFTTTFFGNFLLDAIPYNVASGNVGSDLDLYLELLDDNHNLIGTYNPGNELNSIIDTLLTAGTYYIRVDGKGNAFTSEYGSLGSYSLQANFIPGAPLALRKLELKGQKDKDKHILNWQIDADEAVTEQLIEYSPDGRNFMLLTKADNNTRSYINSNSQQATILYRIAVTFDNGKKYYSNTIILRPGNTKKPEIIGNRISGSTIKVYSPEKYQYEIFSSTGILIKKGILGTGTESINTGSILQGMYVIKFSTNGQIFTEKFVRL